MKIELVFEDVPEDIEGAMQLEAKEPVYRGFAFASGCQRIEHCVGSNPTIVTHLDPCRIDETESYTPTKALTQRQSRLLHSFVDSRFW